jgi:hypothetical protein
MTDNANLPEVDRAVEAGEAAVSVALTWQEIAEKWEAVAMERGDMIDRLFVLIHGYERMNTKLLIVCGMAFLSLTITFMAVIR